MANYVKCEKCGKYGIELIGDQELACTICAELETWDEVDPEGALK